MVRKHSVCRMDVCYTIILLNSETSKCLLQQASTYQNTELKLLHYFLVSLPPKVFHITSLFQILQYSPTAPWNNLILYSDLQSTVWSGPCLLLRTYLCDILITHSAQHTGPPLSLFPTHAELFLDSGSWHWLFLLHKMFSFRSFNAWVLLNIQVPAQILLSQGSFLSPLTLQ